MVRFTIYPDRRHLNTALAVIVGFLQTRGTAHSMNNLVWQGAVHSLAVCEVSVRCPHVLLGSGAGQLQGAGWYPGTRAHYSALLGMPEVL